MKKIVVLFNLILVCLCFSSCAGGTRDTINVPSSGGSTEKPVDPVDPNPEEGYTFTVTLKRNGLVYCPTFDVEAIWYNEFTTVRVPVDRSTGIATATGLDGVYYVCLSTSGPNFTYDPNAYTADNYNRDVEIDLVRYVTPSTELGNGTGPYNHYSITTASSSIFRCKISKKDEKVWYFFTPSEEGTYIIESMVNVYDDAINPIAYLYEANAAYVNVDYPTIYDYSPSIRSGENTKNFQFEINMTKEEFNNIYCFSIQADVFSTNYPINIDFRVRRQADYDVDKYDTVQIIPQELDGYVIENFSSSEYEFKEAREPLGSSYMLYGDHFKYNDVTGYYHKYDEVLYASNSLGYGAGYGPILYAHISGTIFYFIATINGINVDSFYNVQDVGNRALRIFNGTIYESYQEFICGAKYDGNYTGKSYHNVENADGNVKVTKELQIFLQKYAVSQRIFMDGNGVCEINSTYPLFSKEEDQWLFACGYYEKIA